jgi:hypothetical protein
MLGLYGASARPQGMVFALPRRIINAQSSHIHPLPQSACDRAQKQAETMAELRDQLLANIKQ